jgi:hypothetical protein
MDALKGADILKFVKYENTKLKNDETNCDMEGARKRERPRKRL